MKFRQIEAFRYVMITGTTKGAARRLFVTQPAVSRLIAALEADIDIKLFNRFKGRLQPTTAGVRFYNAVEQNFLGLERLDRAAAKIRRTEPRKLTIACTPALSTSLLPVAIKAFLSKKANVLVSVDTATVPQILERLQYLATDMALSLQFPPIAGIEVEHLIEAEFVCAVPKSHPLAQKEIVTPEDFEDENVIATLPAGPLTWDEENKVFADAGIRRKNTVAIHTSHTGYAMIAQGLGIGLMEQFAAPMWKKWVAVRPFRPRLPLPYAMAYPTAHIRSKLVYDFREVIRSVARRWEFQS